MFLDDLATRLVAAGVGVLNSTIFITRKAIVPPTGQYLLLTSTGGTGPTRIQNQASARTKRPTAQIVCRAENPIDAFTMAYAAYNALDGTWNTEINGVLYLSITARQEPTDIGLDDVGRLMVSFNVDVEKNP